VPLSTDLSISCCRVILAVFFFFAGWSFWVVAGAAGVVVAGADVVAAGADVVAAGAGVVAAGSGVVTAGAGAGAAVVSDPVAGAFWAINRPAGTHTATAAAATIRESFCIQPSTVVLQSREAISVIRRPRTMQPRLDGLNRSDPDDRGGRVVQNISKYSRCSQSDTSAWKRSISAFLMWT
jgi:hypothetical protein